MIEDKERVLKELQGDLRKAHNRRKVLREMEAREDLLDVGIKSTTEEIATVEDITPGYATAQHQKIDSGAFASSFYNPPPAVANPAPVFDHTVVRPRSASPDNTFSYKRPQHRFDPFQKAAPTPRDRTPPASQANTGRASGYLSTPTPVQPRSVAKPATTPTPLQSRGVAKQATTSTPVPATTPTPVQSRGVAEPATTPTPLQSRGVAEPATTRPPLPTTTRSPLLTTTRSPLLTTTRTPLQSLGFGFGKPAVSKEGPTEEKNGAEGAPKE